MRFRAVGRYWFEGCFRALEVGKNLFDLAVNRVHVDSRSFVVVDVTKLPRTCSNVNVYLLDHSWIGVDPV